MYLEFGENIFFTIKDREEVNDNNEVSLQPETF